MHIFSLIYECWNSNKQLYDTLNFPVIFFKFKKSAWENLCCLWSVFPIMLYLETWRAISFYQMQGAMVSWYNEELHEYV